MFRIEKILNHNAIIGIREQDQKQCLVLGKGIAFGKKVHDKIETKEENTIYFLENAPKNEK